MNHSVFYTQPHEGKFRFYTLCSPFARCSSPHSILGLVFQLLRSRQSSLLKTRDPRRCALSAHFSSFCVICQGLGGVICCGLTRGWCASPHRLFIQACLQVSRLQQAERDSSQHSPPDSPSCPAASASENRKRLYPLQSCRILRLIKTRPRTCDSHHFGSVGSQVVRSEHACSKWKHNI